MRIKLTALFVAGMIFVHALCYAQTASDYLILQDIVNFKFITQSKNPLTNIVKQIPGYSVRVAPGMLAGADHFDMDHDDKTYEMNYDNPVTHMGVEIQVVQHTNSDSDKWLLHEVEDSYRSNEMQRLGLLSPGAVIKKLVAGGDRIFSIRMGGGAYAWISNNVVIVITYRDLQGGKPEPREVIQAYLKKFPSTIPATLALDNTHDVQWIKDEMDRRLWLCDKWFGQLQLAKADLKTVLQEEIKSMNVFLDYREKYFGIASKDEKNLLAQYLYQNDSTSIQAKLAGYKTWWSAHKGDAITLP